MKATVTSKGQITIPLPIRRKLKLDTGTVLEFDEESDCLRATKAVDPERMRAVMGIARKELAIERRRSATGDVGLASDSTAWLHPLVRRCRRHRCHRCHRCHGHKHPMLLCRPISAALCVHGVRCVRNKIPCLPHAKVAKELQGAPEIIEELEKRRTHFET